MSSLRQAIPAPGAATTASKLVNELVEVADDKALTKTLARYGRVDPLCIDELGYLELDRCGAELLFQLLTERAEHSSIAIASNESFGNWTKTVTDPRLCAAIIDRLTYNGTIIETGTESYRLAHAKAQHASETGKAAHRVTAGREDQPAGGPESSRKTGRLRAEKHLRR
jgi:DNA replication protein DnaC